METKCKLYTEQTDVIFKYKQLEDDIKFSIYASMGTVFFLEGGGWIWQTNRLMDGHINRKTDSWTDRSVDRHIN